MNELSAVNGGSQQMKQFVQQFMQKGTKMGPATLLRAAYTFSAMVVTCHKTRSAAATGAMLEALTQLELQNYTVD